MELNRAKCLSGSLSGSLSVCEFMVHRAACAAKNDLIGLLTFILKCSELHAHSASSTLIFVELVSCFFVL
jgi:hypothetical protein